MTTPRYSWTQPICTDCWDRLNPDRVPYRMKEEFREPQECVHCASATSSGIFVRIDPATAPHPTALHDRPVMTTAEVVPHTAETDSDWPAGDLYHSPIGLFEFQADGIADLYLSLQGGGGRLVCWSTGIGKSHIGMRLSTLFAEDAAAGTGQHDLTVLICEKGKITEWEQDFAQYTRQVARIHHGPNRLKKLAAQELPDVLITTYETAKADLVRFVRPPGKRGTSTITGPLLELLTPLRVLWVCDESGKLRNRTAATYKAFAYTFAAMAKAHPTEHKVVFLTATPIDRDWEDAFNQIRLLRPDLMPTIGQFESAFVRRRDVYGRAKYTEEVKTDFVTMCRPVISRKRKSDPDVVAQFPAKVEESRHLTMAPDQALLYESVESLGYDLEEPLPGLWTALRQIAGSPQALVRSARSGTSVLARTLVEEFGPDYLSSISSVKEAALLEYLEPLVLGQGAKVVVFTFFGQSLLPILAELMRSKGYVVFENHGGLSATEMGRVRQEFRAAPYPCVFLTSDAGSRGINLPEATYVLEYESALTYANRTQRLDRIHRIDSQAPSVSCMTFVVDRTVEVAIMERMSERNAQTDILLDDTDAGEHFLSAADRRQALQIARLSRSTRKSR